MLATAAALVGKDLPATAGPDSFNVLPALLSEKPAKPCRETLVVQGGYIGGLAVRKSPWKLIPDPGKKKNAGPQLFNLADDLGETRNLADQKPAVVKELADLLATVREKAKSRP